MSNTREQLAARKAERLAHANELIRAIASHGRRFFWYGGSSVWDPATKTSRFEAANRYARLELRNGRVYFIDEYTQKAVYTHRTRIPGGWRGFSHGGTLRALVEDMRDYVVSGTRIPRWKIGLPREYANSAPSNIWGYDEQSLKALREQAFVMPIIEPS